MSGMTLGDLVPFILLLVGNILLNFCLFTPYWKVVDPSDTVRDNIYRHMGIWITCTSYNTGNWDCDDFNRWFLGLPMDMQIARSFGLLAFFTGIVAVVTSVTSFSCFPWTKQTKSTCKITSGCCGIVAGVSILIATGFYAQRVIEEYWYATSPTGFNRARSGFTRFVFGWSLFVGWGAGAILLITGLVAAVMGCRNRGEDENNYGDSYFYDPNQPQAHRNYAYKVEQPAPIYDRDYV